MVEDCSDANRGYANAEQNVRSIKEVGGFGSVDTNLLLGRDCVDSFRTCLKRYGFFDSTFMQGVSNDAPNQIVYRARRSVSPRNHPQGTMMKYVTTCYNGWRGSMRVRSIPISRQNRIQPPVTTFVYDPSLYVTTINRNRSNADSDQVLYVSQVTGSDIGMWSGAQFATTEMSQTTSIELPYYSNQRFIQDDEGRVLTFEHNVIESHVVDVSLGTVSDLFNTAIGDDFGLHFFLGVVPMWISN